MDYMEWCRLINFSKYYKKKAKFNKLHRLNCIYMVVGIRQ